jgi:obg-like ATPase 1
MAPKTAPEPTKRVILGRPGNNVRAGIVGMPNAGKSTTFNIMCNMSVPAENFPFCTIDPTEARVQVPDPKFEKLCEAWKPKNEIPAFLTVMDIAGLVKGASEGEGLGNAFLSHIAATDATFHLCRTFEQTSDGEDATHVEGEVDPIRDLEIIANELRLKDIASLEKIVEPLKKEVGRDGKAKEKKDRLETTVKLLDWLKDGKDIRFGSWNNKEIDVLNEYNLLTAKTGIYLVNMSEKDFLRKKNKWLPKLKAWMDENRPGEAMIPYSAAVELKLFEMDDEAKKAYCEENKTQSMMSKIVLTGYHALQLIHFYTAGADEVKCWTIRDGWKAPQAAGTIHTDFERGFIKAEVYNFDDWIAHDQKEAAVKESGKYRQEGKMYEVKDGDIIFFKFNVTTDGKKK